MQPFTSLDPGTPDTDSEGRLCAVICARTGIVIHDHQREKLRETMRDACVRFGYARPMELVQVLEGRPASREQEFLLGEITVSETYFFRDPQQIGFLRDEWLPRTVVAKRAAGDLTLRIWSAGCSSGQELYSLAILLREALPDWRQWKLHLLGTDINTRVLGHALRGRYGRWSFRSTPEALMERYFTRDERGYLIDPSVREMAKFCYLNLRDDSFPSIITETHALDLVLCRNVFIYFEADAVRAVMEKFAACLVPGGILQLAATDPLASVPGLALRHTGDLFHLERVADPAHAPARTAARTDRRRAGRPAPSTASRAQPSAPHAEASGSGPALDRLIADQLWAEALPEIERRLILAPGDPALSRLRAKGLANLGRLADSATLCRELLAHDPLDQQTHLMLGMVLQELDQPQEAEAELRKALYLDPRFAEAHHQLGLLQLRHGDTTGGLKRMRFALELLEEGDRTREVLLAAGMTRGRLADILRSELAIYGDDA